MKDIIDIAEKKRVKNAIGECCGRVTPEIKPDSTPLNHAI